MRLLSNRAAVVVVAVIVAASVLAGERAVAAAEDFSAIPGTTRLTTDVDMGEFSSPNMAVDVVLAPSNESELSDLLASVYDPQSQSYQHWLGQGEFYSRFAPSECAGSGTHRLSAGKWIGSGTIFVPVPAARERTQQHGGGGVQDYPPQLPQFERGHLLFERLSSSAANNPGFGSSSVLSVFRIPCACILTWCVR